MRRRWRAAVGTLALSIAVALGGVSPAISQAEPAPVAGKDFTKPAIVILGYGLTPDGSMRAILRRRVMTGLIVAQFFPQSPVIVTGGNPQNGKTEAGQMRNMLMLLGFPANRIIVEDKANSTVQNARFSVPLAKQAGTSGIILVTSTTHQGRADGDFADAGGNILATVSFPDGSPGTNVAQFARDAISPFVNVG
ncbi:ElyC/SanA/YdcF family protein [Mycobacterium sp. NPDC048908]|uniref:YdcF family protein n=1 Tax=Mycobacterium sp. NPDC048908 TaxID=3364292 RepID=UPI00371721AD